MDTTAIHARIQLTGKTADCKPPICTVNGACPEDLVGPDVTDGTTTVTEETTNE